MNTQQNSENTLKLIKVKENHNTMHLTWIINDICQNSCSYCPPSLHNGSNHNYEWKNAEKFILELFKKYGAIHLSIAGGEPTASPFLPKIIDMFYQRNDTISITTNGNRSIRYWKKLSPKVTSIVFSYHPEFVDPDFLEKVIVCSENTNVSVKVMMYNKFWDHCIEKIEEFSQDTRFSTVPTRIINWLGDKMPLNQDYYTKEQISWFNEWVPIQRKNTINKRLSLGSTHYFSDGSSEKSTRSVYLINKGMTNFKGYTCNIGLSSLFISAQGLIKRGNCLEGGFIGNINSPEDIQWPMDSVICSQLICSCSSDVDIAKEIN
jgi:organic radical activating enzyme